MTGQWVAGQSESEAGLSSEKVAGIFAIEQQL